MCTVARLLHGIIGALPGQPMVHVMVTESISLDGHPAAGGLTDAQVIILIMARSRRATVHTPSMIIDICLCPIV